MPYLANHGSPAMTEDMQRLFHLAEMLGIKDIESMDLDECEHYLDFIAAHQRILKKHMRRLELQAMDDEADCDFVA